MKMKTILKSIMGMMFLLLCMGRIKIRVEASPFYPVHGYDVETDDYKDINDFEGASYDRETRVLTLENYNGGAIKIQAGGKVTVYINGHNEIHGYSVNNLNGVDNGYPREQEPEDFYYEYLNHYTYEGDIFTIEHTNVVFKGNGTLDIYAGEYNDIGHVNVFQNSNVTFDGPNINVINSRYGMTFQNSKVTINDGVINCYHAPTIYAKRFENSEKVEKSLFDYGPAIYVSGGAELNILGGKLNIIYTYPEGEYGEVKIARAIRDALGKEFNKLNEEIGEEIICLWNNSGVCNIKSEGLVNLEYPSIFNGKIKMPSLNMDDKTITPKIYYGKPPVYTSTYDVNDNKDNNNIKNNKENNESIDSVNACSKGSFISDKKYKYKVLKTGSANGKNIGEVSLLGFKKKSYKKVNVASVITVDGIKYKVTKIAKNAFNNNRKIKKVIIGKNIISIGKRAFANCKKLKLVNIKSKKIVRIGKKAFYKGKRTKVKFKLPKGKKKSYKKLLKIA